MIYFDNSATTLIKPPEVAEAVAYAIKNFGNAGRSFYDAVILANREIYNTRSEIAKLMKLKPNLKRTDSLMIASACKNMTRLEVVYTTVSNLVKAVHRIGGEEFLAGMGHYLNPDDKNRVIYHNRAEDRAAKIQGIIEDGAALIERLGEAGVGLPRVCAGKEVA
jgi:hypothetical protein